MNEYFITGRLHDESAPAYIIAEVAQAHDGSLGTAHAYIDLIAEIGADAVKFQAHIAEAESTSDEVFRVNFSYEDKNRYDYWERISFSEEQWTGLANHARENNIDFIVSVFSDAAFEFSQKLGVAAWKLASGEVFSNNRVTRMAETGRPLLISTGMSSWADIDEIHQKASVSGAEFALLQCTSQYPTPFESVGLNVIDELRKRYGVPVGLSDHSASIWPPIAALARGARVLEMHIVFDRRAFGPDSIASLTPADFALVVQARDAFHDLKTHAVDKDIMAEKLASVRQLFSQSIAPVIPLTANTVLQPHHLTTKKPGTGIKPDRMRELVGRRLTRDISPHRLLCEDDFE